MLELYHMGKVFFMVTKAQSLAHTKWLCKYHIVFAPKYRHKIIFANLRESIGEILRNLCKYKGVEILEVTLCMSMSHAFKYPSQNKRVEFYGVPER